MTEGKSKTPAIVDYIQEYRYANILWSRVLTRLFGICRSTFKIRIE